MKILSNYLYTLIASLLSLFIAISCDSCGNKNRDQNHNLTLQVEQKLLKGLYDVDFIVGLVNTKGKEVDLNKFKLKLTVAESGINLKYKNVQGNIKNSNVIYKNLTHFITQQLLKPENGVINIPFKIIPKQGIPEVNITVGLYYEGQEASIIEETVVWKADVPNYQLSLEGIDPTIKFTDEYTFFVENKDLENALNIDGVLISLESELEVTLNGHIVNAQGLLLKTILGKNSIDKGASNGITLKINNTKGKTIVIPVTLQLKDKAGNKVGEEKELMWKPKDEIQLALHIANPDLQGNEADNRKIGLTVTQLGTTIPNKDEIILQLLPEAGTTAIILGAIQTTDTQGKVVYTYNLKKEDIGKAITALSIDPQGSTEASFKAQLLYAGKYMGKEKKVAWQAGEILKFSFEGLEEKDKRILSGAEALLDTGVLQILIKNLGKAVKEYGEVILSVEQDGQADEIAFEVYYNYDIEIERSTPRIGLRNNKTAETDLNNLSEDGNPIKKEDFIKISLQIVDPKAKQQANVTFRIKNAKDDSDIATPVTINWKATASAVGAQEVTSEMIQFVEKQYQGNSAYNTLKNVLVGLKNGKDLGINKVDPSNKAYATPLKQAIVLDRVDIVKVLLTHGADVIAANDIEIKNKLIPLLNLVISRKQEEMALLLLDKLNRDKEIINQHTIQYKTPLLLALERNLSEIAEALIDKGVDLNIPDENIMPLYVAAKKLVRTDIIKKMINKGARIAIKNENEAAALDSAIRGSKNNAIAELLKKQYK
jgi:hypothetical protein